MTWHNRAKANWKGYMRWDDSRFAPSRWETALLCNDVSHWLGASLETALVQNHQYVRSIKTLTHIKYLISDWLWHIKISLDVVRYAKLKHNNLLCVWIYMCHVIFLWIIVKSKHPLPLHVEGYVLCYIFVNSIISFKRFYICRVLHRIRYIIPKFATQIHENYF